MSEQTPTVKHKTKAKVRYLKGKKDRRKRRRTLNNANKPKNENKKKDNTSSDSDQSDVEEDTGPATTITLEGDIEMQEGVERKSPKVEVRKKEKRPKKKRKIEKVDEPENNGQAYPQEDMIVDIPTREPQEVSTGTEHVKKHVETDSPVLIPSFPMPVQPPPASRAQLTLQGMDSAMLGAEIVEPGLTEGLSKEGGVATRLSTRMLKRLGELGITELFAVQTVLIPFLLPTQADQQALYQPYNPPRDVCASAPTGSGKTLAYVIPIVEILCTRVVTRLRALVILPTRDLVQQVRETFEACCKGTKLQIASVTGQHSFAHEQAQLVGNASERLEGGSSRVDILICTPGRLIDHVNGTPNFTLQHLRFLVVDEADRLLTQSFQEWLKQVLAAIKPPSIETAKAAHVDTNASRVFPQPDAVAPAWMSPLVNGIRMDIHKATNTSCQKLLFSATLTRDPAKIASLQLRDPRYIIVRGKVHDEENAMDVDESHYMETFETPTTLREWMLVCESSNKPLFLFLLAHHYNATNALVFTKSAESTSRLLNLLAFFEKAWSQDGSEGKRAITAEAFSSDLAASQRKSVLERFKQKKIDILICSDLISRGMDIPHVSHVINYDVPIDIRKYVHRVGRTARAGREGDAWSLVEEQEMHHFKVMMKQSNHWSKVKKVKAKKGELEELEKFYQIALQRMKDHYSQAN